MSDPKEFEELPDLDDLEHLSLDDLEDEPAAGEKRPGRDEVAEVAELEELEELEAPAPAATPAGARASAAGAPRDLEKAPLMLRKAAWVLIVASLLPWLAAGSWDLGVVLAKGLILIGGWLLIANVRLRAGEDVPGPIRSIGGMHARALDGLGVLLMVIGIAPVIELALGGSAEAGTLALEKGFLAIGLIAIAQILGYEKGGKFNPMMGLIIPFAGLAGIGRLVTVVMNFDLFALLGSLGAIVAGGIAGWTMFLAMKEAKAHGEAKKKAAMAARREARRSSRPAAR